MDRVAIVAGIGVAMLLAGKSTGRAQPKAPPECAQTAIAEATAALDARDPCRALDLVDQALKACRAPGTRKALSAFEHEKLTVTRAECRQRAEVKARMDSATKGRPETVALALASTVKFGCHCPPLVDARFEVEGTSFPESFVYPLVTAGVPDLVGTAPESGPTSVPGTFVVTGSYTGRSANAYEWARLRGAQAPPATGDGVEDWKAEHPVFQVTSWCFRPPKRMDASTREAIRKVIPKSSLCSGRK